MRERERERRERSVTADTPEQHGSSNTPALSEAPLPPARLSLVRPRRLALSSAQQGAGLSLILHAHHHPQLSSAT